MAQFTKRLSAGGNQYDLILDVNQSSQSIANNTSAVSWSLWIRKNSGSGYHASDTKNWSVNIGGQTKSGTIAGYNFSGKSSISLGSGSFTIAHNSDGTKSISASGTFTDSGVTGIGSGTASGSLTLTTIPRASSFGTISGSTLGSGITVNINRATSSFTHSMWYSFGTATWQVIGTGIGTSTTFTPPLTLGSQIPSTTSGTMTLILRTLNGSTQIGSDVTKTINVSIPGSVVPSAGSLSAAQGNSNNAGTYVQGFSSVKLTASGYAGSYGSTVKSVQITGAGHTFNANTGTTGVLNNTGNVQFTSTITDSRGRKSYAYVTVNFLPYSPPKIVSASIQRTNASGVATWNGTYMKYTYHVKVASLIVGGVQKNNVKIVYFDYGTAGTNWGNATHTTVIEASGNKTYGTISVTSSVPARINAYDNMGRYATWTGQVSAGTVALDIGDSNIGVGKFHERGTIDAVGGIYQNDGHVVHGWNGLLPAGNLLSHTYLASLKGGIYSCAPNVGITKYPTEYGFVHILKDNPGGSSGVIMFYAYVGGDMWKNGFNHNGAGSWQRILTDANVASLARRYENSAPNNRAYSITKDWGSQPVVYNNGNFGGITASGSTLTFNGNFTNVTVSVMCTITASTTANAAYNLSGNIRRGSTLLADGVSGWTSHTAGYTAHSVTILCSQISVGDTLTVNIASSVVTKFSINASVVQVMGYAY